MLFCDDLCWFAVFYLSPKPPFHYDYTHLPKLSSACGIVLPYTAIYIQASPTPSPNTPL